MSHDLPLFPVETAAFAMPVPAITRRHFLLAYWPAGRWWTVFAKTLYATPDDAALLRAAEKLAGNGWAHVRVMALPERV